MQNRKKEFKLKIKELTEPIYNRQTDESDAAWQAFCLYRDMSDADRTITAVSVKLQKSFTLCRRWAKMWSWQKRVVAWQNEQLVDELDALRAQHAKAAKNNITLIDAFKSEIVKYIKWFKDNKQDMMAGMNPKDVVWIFQNMLNLEQQMYEEIFRKEEQSETNTGEQIIFTFER